MDATLSLLNLAGAIALLLWGVHMVQSGVQRAFGAGNHRVSCAQALSSRIRAAAAGVGVDSRPSKQHCHGFDGSFVRGQRLRCAFPRACGHARRERGHHPHRPGPVFRRVAPVSPAPPRRSGDVPDRRDANARRWPRGDRARTHNRALRLNSPASLSPQNSVSRTSGWRGRSRG